MKTQSKHLFLLGLLTFVAIIATGCPHKNEPVPEPTPTPAPTVLSITMKTGEDIQKLLISAYLKANNGATSFKASKTPAPAGVTTANTRLSADGSETECVAWFDNNSKTILYYAKGYTDAGKKIPLAVNSKNMFKLCSSLKEIDISGFDASKATSYTSMFEGCTALTSIVGFDTLNTPNVTSFKRMFENCSKLTTIDVSSFAVSKVAADFASMFEGCTALTTISGLDTLNTTNATSFQGMFKNCSKLTTIDVSSFDTSKATNFTEMFYGCTALTTIYAKAGTDWSSSTTSMSSEGMFL
ncbi:MAG: BspA family leucine-rich repeat surface protein, partial [Treponema sp.]|nr:BspA family leucine-rich repeat surface protein [Treponema sp.]